MKRGAVGAALAVAFSGLLVSSAARADYVDFADAFASYYGSGDVSWSTTINGVTVTATPANGAYLYADGDAGFNGFNTEFVTSVLGTEVRSGFADGGFSVTFSDLVTIDSIDLFDYYRNSTNSCLTAVCPEPANNTVGTYTVTPGGASTVLVSPFGSDRQSGDGYSAASGGWLQTGGAVEDHTFTQGVGQSSTRIDFAPVTLTLDPGVDSADHFTYFGIRGVSFTPAGTVAVPELNPSTMATALTLLIGALVLAADRRRRQTARSR